MYKILHLVFKDVPFFFPHSPNIRLYLTIIYNLTILIKFWQEYFDKETFWLVEIIPIEPYDLWYFIIFVVS